MVSIELIPAAPDTFKDASEPSRILVSPPLSPSLPGSPPPISIASLDRSVSEDIYTRPPMKATREVLLVWMFRPSSAVSTRRFVLESVATTPVWLETALIALRRAPSASFAWTFTAPISTPLMDVKPEVMTKAATAEAPVTTVGLTVAVTP
ncbi:MAG: hypothetical protein AAFU79_02365 [Myxococcota bacterium]